MRRCFLLLAVVTASLFLGGCAATEETQSPNTGGVSTIPWNRPERGEGMGIMGGMMNTR